MIYSKKLNIMIVNYCLYENKWFNVNFLRPSQAQYMFAYDVNVPDMGNDFGHTERRDGPRTDGMYRVRLPDGRMQVLAGFHY